MDLLYSDLYKHSNYQCKISPNNYYVANAVENRLVVRRNDVQLTVLQVHEARRPIDYIQWSPDSQYILMVNYEKSRVDVRSSTDSKWQGSIVDEGFPFVQVKWSADSKNIICISELKLRIAIWNLCTEELRVLNHIKYSEKGFEKSPDSRFVAVIEKHDGKDYTSIYHANSFILLQRFELDTVDVENIKWSPDSMCIAVWDNPLYHKLLVYRQDGQLLHSYSGYDYGLGIRCVQWSPDNQIIAIGNYDDTIHLLSTLSWELIGTLNHPTTLGATTETNILEEILVSAPKPHIDYRHVLRRPFNIPIRRPNYNDPNPKVGVGFITFSPDGRFICSKSDQMPAVIWIWQLSSLQCLHMLIFEKNVRQIIWSPTQDHMLSVSCADKNLHFVQLTVANDGIDLSASTIPTSDFSIKKIKWSQRGNSILLMDQELFCLAVAK